MTDREMLELAARAAGYVVESHHVSGGAWVYPVDEVPNADGDYPGLFLWSPREDDGDALRLAVQLMIRVSVNRAFRLSIPGSVTVEYPDRDGFYFALGEAVTNSDPYAATRLAIFRAAAEIGRQMEETFNG